MQKIADRICGEQSLLGWLTDECNGQPPVTSAQLLAFLRARQAVTPTVLATAGRVPAEESQLAVDDFANLVTRRTASSGAAAAQEHIRGTDIYGAMAAAAPAERVILRAAVEDLRRIRSILASRPEPWIPAAVTDIVLGRDRGLVQQHSTTEQALIEAEFHMEAVGNQQVTGLDGLEVGVALGHARALHERLASGKKLSTLGMPSKARREAAELLTLVRVDGRTLDAVEPVATVLGHLTTEHLLRPVEQVWYGGPQSTPLAQRQARLADENDLLATVLELRRPLQVIRETAAAIAGMPAPDFTDDQTVGMLVAALDAVDLDGLQADIDAAVGPARAALNHARGKEGSAPCVQAMLNALEDWDLEAYSCDANEMAVLRQANPAVEALAAARKPLDDVWLDLANQIDVAPQDPVWDERLPEFAAAWAWSAWNAWLAARIDPAEERTWRTTLAEADDEARRLLNQLAANHGWSQCLGRMTPEESVQLGIYANAVKKIGKGTGKHAPRWRAEARKSLEQCQSAIPAWIMPLHRVAETMSVAEPNPFDVVIIDEASQSSLEALMLTWLAPRVVIVGDDKQLGPQSIGLEHEAVFTLQQRYLSDLPTSGLFGPLTTVFDLAVALAQGGKVMLTEHFRCMPEIIGFSNSLCYNNQLQPLGQYGADRLPPLRTTYVRGAMVARRGQSIVNEAEAQALVDAVAKCCADPAYDGKTMGVVTLLGAHQNKLITDRLIALLGVREVEQQRLRVGNAEAFQGDERHVVFMSMVSSLQGIDGPRMIGPLTKTADEQRFNVAASRAQDQLWLFHSVAPSNLSTKDLRRIFLQHLLKPPHESAILDLGEVTRDTRHHTFDSLFEQRVYLDLTDRGYRVRPQYRVGRYRIDLVVEGGTQRLAIECDGDEFHGAEQQPDDAVRQRELERVGWTFWRVRGSQYFRDPAGSLESLWTLLDKLGIEPGVADVDAEETVTDELQAEPLALVVAEPVMTPDDPAPVQRPPDTTVTARPATPATTRPTITGPPDQRILDGKLLLSGSAHGRVLAELDGLQDFLATTPSSSDAGVDRNAANAAVAAARQLREAARERIEHLHRVLAQSCVQPTRAGGDWVTAGSKVTIRYADGDEETGVIASPQAGDKALDGGIAFSPTSPLGQVLIGADLGDLISYETPTGELTVQVIDIDG